MMKTDKATSHKNWRCLAASMANGCRGYVSTAKNQAIDTAPAISKDIFSGDSIEQVIDS
jgi:hypothetical protein